MTDCKCYLFNVLCARFKMAVLMDDRWFPYVESSNKKEGKKEAADVALRVLMAEGSYQLNETPASVSIFLLRRCFECFVWVTGKAFIVSKGLAPMSTEGSSLGPKD